MTRHYLFADESGNFDFSRRRGATKYFAVGTVHLVGDDAVAAVRADLLRLRTELGWRGLFGGGAFHATDDRQLVRRDVFAVLQRHAFQTDVTLLEKSKAQPHLRRDDPTFFRYAWQHHLQDLAPQVGGPDDEVMVAVATIGTHRLRAAFRAAVGSAIEASPWTRPPRLVFASADSDPALQAADYLLWAVMRSWHGSDDGTLAPVIKNVRSQRDVFASGCVHYY